LCVFKPLIKEIIDHLFLPWAKLFNRIIEPVQLFFIHLLVDKELLVGEGKTKRSAFFQPLPFVQPLGRLLMELSFEALEEVKFDGVGFVDARSVVFQVNKNLLNGILHQTFVAGYPHPIGVQSVKVIFINKNKSLLIACPKSIPKLYILQGLISLRRPQFSKMPLGDNRIRKGHLGFIANLWINLNIKTKKAIKII